MIYIRNILLTLFLFSSLLFAKDANNNPEKVIEDFFFHFNEWKIVVTSLGDYQALSRTGICKEQMLINYNDKTTKN